ncbi:hypothetical protein [Arthrospira platensis]|uniref:hypothetical protein n=1 Tax=Limnospira TaxID=2596745 RepID=UPI0007A0F1D4|nr:hypothetical protein [Arthrospira platensis]AMW30743.1 hypothetical protein AP285_25245 [Arthrospira platensis YZ]MDT9312571.1 hypothetical protein [Limnospira sp. Paracas R14]WAK74005.1 hypothetical protein AP9108_36370 [Arthrospira sp. PCC 9108]
MTERNQISRIIFASQSRLGKETRFLRSSISGGDRILSPTFPQWKLTLDEVLAASGIREL